MRPYKPEPVEALRERFARSIRTIHDLESIRLGLAERPAENGEAIFDFEDGTRLIAFRVATKCGRLLSLTASRFGGTEVGRKWDSFDLGGGELRAVVEAHYLEISGAESPPEFKGADPKTGILIWKTWEVDRCVCNSKTSPTSFEMPESPFRTSPRGGPTRRSGDS